MKRKGISVVLAAVMIAGMAAGCGAKGSSDAAERKDTKLTLIHDMNEDSAISFLEQAIEQFEEKNPDVKIDMETLSSDDYNSMLDTAGKSSTNRISRSVSSMKNETSYNEKPLKEIGITVDEKTGKLSVDETTFKSADTEKIKNLFNGTGSYAYSVATKAAMTESYAKSEAAKSNTYTKNGTYNYNYNSGNIFTDMF